MSAFSKLQAFWDAEPARVIGIIGAVVVIVAEQLIANGVVTSDPNVNILHTLIAALPLILAEITRTQVSPAK